MKLCSTSLYPLLALKAFLIFQDGEHYFLFCFLIVKIKSYKVSKNVAFEIDEKVA